MITILEKSSKRVKNATRDVVNYCKQNPKFRDLADEIIEKDIWVQLWLQDMEFSLNYNTLRSPEYITDKSLEDLIFVMGELFPGSFYEGSRDL